MTENNQLKGFDPSKSYEWSPETPFTLSGEEFGILLQTLRGIVSSPETQKALLAVRSLGALESTLGRNIQAGVVKEQESPKKEEIKELKPV